MPNKKIFRKALKQAFTGTHTGLKGRSALAPMYSAGTGGVWNMKTSRKLWKVATGRETNTAMTPEKARQSLAGMRKARAAATVGNIFTGGLINLAILGGATRRSYDKQTAALYAQKCHRVADTYAANYHISHSVMFAKLQYALGLSKDESNWFNEDDQSGAAVTDEIGWHNFMKDHGDEIEGMVRNLD